MKTTLLIISLFISTLQSCTSDENTEYQPTLPPVTQTGENTFGCYVDGNLLVPRSGCGGGYLGGETYAMSLSGTSENHTEINVIDCKKGNSIDIIFGNIHDNGISTSTIENGNCIDHEDLINIKIRCQINNKWYCSVENTGTVKVTRYDYGNVFSGIFNCKVVNRDEPTDIIEITDGRFDIKWLTLLGTNFP